MDDPEAEYTEYVRGRIPALRRMAFLLCGDEHRADDLVQTAITKLYVHWARVRAMEHPDRLRPHHAGARLPSTNAG